MSPPAINTASTLPPPSNYAFTEPLPYTLGNERRDDLMDPPYKDLDFSLQKDFPIWESIYFQFRSEFFNIFNHTNYGSFANNLQSPSNFGQITGVVGNGRIIQLSGKIDF